MEWLVWLVRLGGFCFLAAGLLVILQRPAWFAGRKGDALFLLLCLVGLFATRMPAAFTPLAFNPDEAQTLAQAHKYLTDPIPWRSVDGVTVGPVNSWILSLFLLAGLPYSTFTARIAAMLLLGAALACVFILCRRHTNAFAARFALFPWFVVLGLSMHPDYQHFASEIPAVLCLAAGLAFFPTRSGATGPAWRLALGGITLGLVPFTKLQAAPLAVLVTAACGIALILRTRRTVRRPLAIFSTGVLAPGILILAITAASGAFGDFFQSYLGVHDRYGKLFLTAAETVEFWKASELLKPLLLLTLAAFAVVLLLFPRQSKENRLFPACLLAATAVTIFIVGKPGTTFPHYLLFFAFTGPMLVGMAAHLLLKEDRPHIFDRRATVAAFLLVAMTLPAIERGANLCLPRGYSIVFRNDPYLNEKNAEALASIPSLASQVGGSLRDHLPGKNHELAVWGWMPEFYVESRMRMATPDSVTTMAMIEHSGRDYYRTRFMNDLRAALPSAIVDATGTGCFEFEDRGMHGIESVEALSKFVSEDYALADQFGPPGTGPRVFIRKDLATDG